MQKTAFSISWIFFWKKIPVVSPDSVSGIQESRVSESRHQIETNQSSMADESDPTQEHEQGQEEEEEEGGFGFDDDEEEGGGFSDDENNDGGDEDIWEKSTGDAEAVSVKPEPGLRQTGAAPVTDDDVKGKYVCVCGGTNSVLR